MAAIEFRRGSTATHRASKALSLTPLIDVVFILLLFFMLATNYRYWQSVPLETAIVEKGPSIANDASITIGLEQDKLFWNTEPVSKRTLLVRLNGRLERQPAVQVIVAPAAAAPVQSLVSVLEWLQSAGVTNMTLAVNPIESP